ncbi:DNA replication complex GINS protein PSF2 [Syncephalastrum racemosum]|uniref:DNA replication complex GINS protein PSF2 n=1 Tax=Syncephalastrum racemosum TaxID=13706 RepID=A0A1X2HIG4_SYNRA|nr:DNA replication complex GINS protein PSF2 [Syncephalastrum racemosum]
MALPLAQQKAFTPQEIEFIVGNASIQVIPTRRMPTLTLIQETFGPFRPPFRTDVPLWLALSLKKNNRCTIVPPEWLNVENLKKVLETEEESDEFAEVPFYYMEMAHILLRFAVDDIPDAEEIRRLLKDLRETRQSKARAGLRVLDDAWLGMNNLSLMEVNEIRPFYARAFKEMQRLNPDSRSNQFL